MFNLRPTSLNDVIGQANPVECLRILISSAKSDQQAIPHLLFDGPPGTGKTTLANIVANEMGSSIQVANGANLRSIKVILPYLAKITENSVLFVDEIHRMTSLVSEFLYPVMEDFRVDISDSKSREAMSFPVSPFTLIGATTHAGCLPEPLRNRFGHNIQLTTYSDLEITTLLEQNSKKLSVSISKSVLEKLAKRSRGIPRLANNLLKWLRSFIIAHSIVNPNEHTLNEAMKLIGIDQFGLSEHDRKYIEILDKMKGEAVGLKTLTSLLNLTEETITDVIEPYLLQLGLIYKTGKGRVLV